MNKYVIIGIVAGALSLLDYVLVSDLIHQGSLLVTQIDHVIQHAQNQTNSVQQLQDMLRRFGIN